MSKHVFISHSHKDSAVATSIVTALEQRGIACWIAPRDVTPGGSYAESILTAIETASCFVLIYSEHSNMSSHVLREVERALKFGVNIVPVRFDDSTPSKSLDYLLATVHWLAIPQESRDRSIARAAEQIAEWLTNFMKNPASPLPVRASALQNALVTSLEQPRSRHGMLVGVGILLLLVAAAAFATGHLPFSKWIQQRKALELSAKSPAVPVPVESPEIVPQLGAVNRGTAPKVRRSIGYAGPKYPAPAVRSSGGADRNNPQNQLQATLPDPRMQNPNGMYAPPPPPPGPPMSQNPNGPGAGAPPDGRYPPPPPPGRPMFGPGNGPGHGPGGPPPPPPR